MKTKAVLLLVCISVLVCSCELIDPFLNPTTSSGCLLTSTSFSVPNDPAHLETEYNYDTSDKLIEIIRSEYDQNSTAYIERYVISYLGDKVNQIKQYNTFLNNPEELLETHTFFFSGVLIDSIASIAYNGSQQNHSYSLCNYTNNKLTKLTNYRYNLIDSISSLYRTIDLIWASDNISKITTQYASSGTLISEYQYDDKKDPMNHFGLSFTTLGSLTMLSQNNVVASQNTVWDGSVQSNTIEITYNAQDYPVSTTPSNNYTTTYTYNCK